MKLKIAKLQDKFSRVIVFWEMEKVVGDKGRVFSMMCWDARSAGLIPRHRTYLIVLQVFITHIITF